MAQLNKAIKLISTRPSRSVGYNSVVFYITPELSESRSVSYAEISDVRLPSSILIWMGSPSRNFNLNGKFLARTQQEADVAFRDLNLLKSWCVTQSIISGGKVSRFGAENKIIPDAASPSDVENVNKQDTPTLNPTNGTSTQPHTPSVERPQTFTIEGSLFKDTPEVLFLEGYNGQFRRIPVVITSLNITFPSDVDYIQNSNGIWVPILQEIGISLKEAREINGARGSIGGFKLEQFKQGILEYW